MISKFIFASLLLMGLHHVATAQQKFSVSGSISDAASKETIINARVVILENNTIGTVSNEYGFYSLTLAQGKYHVITSYMGYASDTAVIDLNRNVSRDVLLKTESKELQTVTVKATKENSNVTSAQLGIEKINMAEMNKLPVLLGERDVLKTIQLLPGIKSAGEGNSGFNVRGGTADQNLILLDEAPVYNASHLLGFFSTFNSDAIKDATVYKGIQPAQFGGRLSSVLDIKMKDGNKEKFEANGSVGLISSKLSVEGPMGSDKGSCFLYGRITYADFFI